MARAGQRTELIVIERSTVTTNEYNEEVESWGELLRRRVRVRFGSAQEKREAAQEGGTQSASFECERSAALDAVTIIDRISYLGSSWDIVELAPLDTKTIRFTAVRNV